MSHEPPAYFLPQLRELLSTRRRCAITTHFNPDADALGSSLGLMHLLRAAGHEAQVVLPNTPSGDLHWMPGYREVTSHDVRRAESEAVLSGSDLLFCLDFNRADRVGQAEAALRRAPVHVLIDHHREPDGFARLAWTDTSACATAQMIHDLAVAMGWQVYLDAEAATCLYAGIMMDSGSFRFSSTTPHTLRVAAALMEAGAVPERIHSAIMDNNREDRLRLLGFALNERMEVFPDLGTALFTLSTDDLQRFQYRPGDTEGLVNYGLTMTGIRLAVFLVERPDVVKISMRSKGALPVNTFLAAHFNGGGHLNAAGGQEKAPLDTVRSNLMAALPAFLAQHPE
jgi:phosphoesterase RecJ-like protein